MLVVSLNPLASMNKACVSKSAQYIEPNIACRLIMFSEERCNLGSDKSSYFTCPQCFPSCSPTFIQRSLLKEYLTSLSSRSIHSPILSLKNTQKERSVRYFAANLNQCHISQK